VGRFIRLTRIDELPQILNVVKGTMSFIGPRPERPHFVEQLAHRIPHYRLRTLIKPGLTGWAQVHLPYGDSEADAARKLEYDLYYLKNRSIGLDVRVFLKTIRVVLMGKGQ
jgi:lipopolysaccharide/colanic/teichoic acid biosynthesis glycosyltransferase